MRAKRGGPAGLKGRAERRHSPVEVLPLSRGYGHFGQRVGAVVAVSLDPCQERSAGEVSPHGHGPRQEDRRDQAAVRATVSHLHPVVPIRQRSRRLGDRSHPVKAIHVYHDAASITRTGRSHNRIPAGSALAAIAGHWGHEVMRSLGSDPRSPWTPESLALAVGTKQILLEFVIGFACHKAMKLTLQIQLLAEPDHADRRSNPVPPLSWRADSKEKG